MIMNEIGLSSYVITHSSCMIYRRYYVIILHVIIITWDLFLIKICNEFFSILAYIKFMLQ